MKMRLSPHEYFITQGKGPERPFTGDHWWVKDVGNYYCKVCDSSLFPSHYKFFPTTGHCAFFASHKDATKIVNDEVECSKCSSHLGHISDDGPAPTYKHLKIKSAALRFEPKAWFTVPITKNKKLKMQKEEEYRLKKLEKAKEKKPTDQKVNIEN